MFQSTRPRGARLGMRPWRWTLGAVSIHAPARGATGLEDALMAGAVSFNPRAREGRDDCHRR